MSRARNSPKGYNLAVVQNSRVMSTSSSRIPKTFPRLQVMRGLDGLGLFAMEPIKKGTYVIEYVGEIITPEEGDRRNSRYIFGVNERIDIDGTPRWNIARYINHSCRPNCDAEEIKDRVFIVARRNIMLGEEITYNYGKEYFDEWIKPKGCRCVKCAGESARAWAKLAKPQMQRRLHHHAVIRSTRRMVTKKQKTRPVGSERESG